MTPEAMMDHILERSKLKMIVDGHLPAEETFVQDAIYEDTKTLLDFVEELMADARRLTGRRHKMDMPSIDKRQDDFMVRAVSAYANLERYLCVAIARFRAQMPSNELTVEKTITTDELPFAYRRTFLKLRKSLNFEHHLCPTLGFIDGRKVYALLGYGKRQVPNFGRFMPPSTVAAFGHITTATLLVTSLLSVALATYHFGGWRGLLCFFGASILPSIPTFVGCEEWYKHARPPINRIDCQKYVTMDCQTFEPKRITHDA